MEIASSTLTAILVGVIIVLTKVIEWIIKRSTNGKTTTQAKDYNGFGEALMRIDTRLDALLAGFVEIRQERVQLVEYMANSESSHERIVERLGDVVSNLDRVVDGIRDLRDQIKNR